MKLLQLVSTIHEFASFAAFARSSTTSEGL